MTRKYFILATVLLLIFLFVYASVSKLFDFYTFNFQLGKSPLIPQSLTDLTALAIPASELLIVVFLITDKYRLLGLYSSFFLMTLFTVYLFYILKYSYYIPCSCGGILGQLNWETHIYFNFFFIIISAVSVLLYNIGLLPKKIK
jgi:hypothetical protein